MRLIFILSFFLLISCKSTSKRLSDNPNMEDISDAFVDKTFPDPAKTINKVMSGPTPGCSVSIADEMDFEAIYHPTPGIIINPSIAEVETKPAFPTWKPEEKFKNTPSLANFPHGNPIEGALKIFASKYQTCNILDNIGGTSGFDSRSPEVLEIWKNLHPPKYPSIEPPGMCLDSTKLQTREACRVLRSDDCQKILTSPLQYSQGWRQAPVKNNTINVLDAATDCSSFISTAMLAVGLRMSKGNSMSNYTKTTGSIENDLNQNKSCFDKVKVTNLKDLIRSGDVLNDSKGGHVVMIDYVGLDPLGVESIVIKLTANQMSKDQALEKCQYLNMANMNLGIIHSSTSSTGNGIMRERSNVIKSDTARRILIGYARGICADLVTDYPNTNKHYSGDAVCKTCSVLRHKGKADSSCIYDEKPKIQGEGCINECLQNYI